MQVPQQYNQPIYFLSSLRFRYGYNTYEKEIYVAYENWLLLHVKGIVQAPVCTVVSAPIATSGVDALQAVSGAKGLGGGLGNIDTKPISFNYGDLQADVGNPLFPRTVSSFGFRAPP